MTHAAANSQVTRWDEQAYQQIDERSKCTRASVGKTYRGDIVGESTFESLMFYRGDGTAIFTGLEHVVGTVAGRAGSFVLHVTGTYADGTASGDCAIVTDSGAGELRGLRGAGRFTATHADFPNVHFTLDYSLNE